MKTFRGPKFFLSVAATLWLLLVGALAWQWHRAERSAQDARAAWATALAEREHLARALPAATTAGSAAIDAAVTEAESDLAALRPALGSEIASTREPETPLELWYETAATRDRLRAMADELGVALSAEEQFGLASHRRAGPAGAERAVVARQRVMVEQLMATLFTAQPHALLSVRRERPREDAGGEPTDFFRMDPRLSLRMPGMIEATAFRLEFTGQTAVLRAFLNGVTSSSKRWFVRSVEVVPPLSAEGARGPRSEAGLESEERPIAAPALSRFIVIIEDVVLTSPLSS